jgi:hypothetical protein
MSIVTMATGDAMTNDCDDTTATALDANSVTLPSFEPTAST